MTSVALHDSFYSIDNISFLNSKEILTYAPLIIDFWKNSKKWFEF